MTADEDPGGPLDVATLEVLAQRAGSHYLADGWTFQPDTLSPRYLEIALDGAHYPDAVETARIDIRWYQGGDYTVHYVESWTDERWQCRWDTHPKPTGPRRHFHPPPDASPDVEASPIEDQHHLGVLFAVLDRIESRVSSLHEE